MLTNGDFHARREFAPTPAIRSTASDFAKLSKDHEAIREMSKAIGLLDVAAMTQDDVRTAIGSIGPIGSVEQTSGARKPPAAAAVQGGRKSVVPVTRTARNREPNDAIADRADGFPGKAVTERKRTGNRVPVTIVADGMHRRVCGYGETIWVGPTRQDLDRRVKSIYGDAVKLPDRLAGDRVESEASLKRQARREEIAKTNKELMKRILNAKSFVSTFRDK